MKKENMPNRNSITVDHVKSVAAVVVSHLNIQSDRNFKPLSARNFDLIKHALDKGYAQEDLNAIINHKCVQWQHIDSMWLYIRPSTLFSISNVKKYHTQSLLSLHPQNAE